MCGRHGRRAAAFVQSIFGRRNAPARTCGPPYLPSYPHLTHTCFGEYASNRTLFIYSGAVAHWFFFLLVVSLSITVPANYRGKFETIRLRAVFLTPHDLASFRSMDNAAGAGAGATTVSAGGSDADAVSMSNTDLSAANTATSTNLSSGGSAVGESSSLCVFFFFGGEGVSLFSFYLPLSLLRFLSLCLCGLSPIRISLSPSPLCDSRFCTMSSMVLGPLFSSSSPFAYTHTYALSLAPPLSTSLHFLFAQFHSPSPVLSLPGTMVSCMLFFFTNLFTASSFTCAPFVLDLSAVLHFFLPMTFVRNVFFSFRVPTPNFCLFRKLAAFGGGDGDGATSGFTEELHVEYCLTATAVSTVAGGGGGSGGGAQSSSSRTLPLSRSACALLEPHERGLTFATPAQLADNQEEINLIVRIRRKASTNSNSPSSRY